MLDNKSMQPITKLGMITVLRGVKRPQKTVVGLIPLWKYQNIIILGQVM